MANKTIDEMKRALLGSYDEEGKPQSGIFDYVFAPGEYVKGVMAGTPGKRKTGREVLENWGITGPNQEGLDWGDVGGFALDVFNPLEPLNLLFGGGLLKSAPAIAKGIRALPKLLRPGGATAAYNAAKGALMGLPAAAKASAPGLAFGLGVPMAGAQMMNPPGEEGPDWRDLMGMGMMTLPMALPLGMAAARKMKGGRAAAAKEALQPTKQGPFYSRLEEALLNAPEKFETRPEAVRVVPAKTITHPQTGAIIKEIPEQQHVTPGATAYEQMRSYLEGRAHPQEIDWVLGDQFADQPNISKQAMLDAYNEAKISLETQRHGGAGGSGWKAGLKDSDTGSVSAYIGDPFKTRREAARYAIDATGNQGIPVVARTSNPEHGPLEFPDMLIPGGKNATEVPIKLGMPKPEPIYDELGHYRGDRPQGFPDTAGHFGDDVVAWTIHDQRKMPDGKTATFIQELQSDWHQKGAKKGYGKYSVVDEMTGQSVGEDYIEAAERFVREGNASGHRYKIVPSKSSVPNAPFKGNEWTKLAMKQAMADAIARGDDYVLLPPPELVSRTQGMPIEKARKFYGEIVPNLANEMLKPHGIKLEKMPLPGVNSSAVKNKLYDRANNLRHEAHKMFGDGWMNRAGETGTLESEMWQQIRELEVRAERGQPEVFGFRIPDALKQQVETKGFPLMQMGLPLAGAAGLGAYAASQEGA